MRGTDYLNNPAIRYGRDGVAHFSKQLSDGYYSLCASNDAGGKTMDDLAIKRLKERLQNKPEQINNASLYAGSPMYYYCKLCGHTAAVLPESHWERPPSHCKECKDLKDVSGQTDATLLELATAR